MSLLKSLMVRFENLRVRIRSIWCRALLPRQHASIGPGLIVRAGATFEVAPTARVRVGRNLTIAENACIFAGTGSDLIIGDDVFLGRGSMIAASGAIRIGDRTQIAHHVTLIDSDHDYRDRGKNLLEQRAICAPISVGRDVWLGTQVVVLKGVTIEDRAVVGAGTVITRDVPTRVIAVGNSQRHLPMQKT